MPEESTRSALSDGLKKYLREAPFFCKITELIFCIISVGLIVDPFNKLHQEDLNHVAIVYVSVCSYILINGILIVNYLLGERLPKRIGISFSAIGAILTCTAGFILIHDWNDFPNNLISQYLPQYTDQMAASGFFALFAAFVFAVDSYLMNKYEQ